MSYEMYPQKECFVCGKKWVIGFMGHIEGHYACPQHYNEIIETYGVNVNMNTIIKDNDRLKQLYNYFVFSINRIVKYEKFYNISLLNKIVVKHKELIKQMGKTTDTITLVENDIILKELLQNYLISLVPSTLKEDELRIVAIDKSYYSHYYEMLTGRRVKERGGNKWLL